jgi:integrase
MSFQVSGFKRLRSGAFRARKAIPADVRAEYQATYGQGWEAIFHADPSVPLGLVRSQWSSWLSLVEGRIAALRATKGGRRLDLSQREADALAGDWYRWFTSQHRDNPGSPKSWSSLRETLWDMAETAGDAETREADFNDPEVLEAIEIGAHTERFLTDRGLALSPDSKRVFLSAVTREFLNATKTLQRRASGDWGPDRHLECLPETSGAERRATTGQHDHKTAMELWNAYVLDKKTKPATIDRWRCVFSALDSEGWQRPEWDAQRWADSLIGTCAVGSRRPRSAKSVRETWIAAPRAVWKWAKRKRLVVSNPFVGVVVEVPRKVETRETGKAFSDAEVLVILSAASQVKVDPAHSLTAAKHWIPWMCAYTGARVGELTQLRVQDIEKRGSDYVVRITPAAGTVKTDTARTVPLHPHLVALGLIEYVEAVGVTRGPNGPLFCHPPKPDAKGRPLAIQTREKLAAWVRGLGVTDQGVSPNHGWRHTFKRRARRAGIEPGIRDAICGHKPRGVAEAYEHATVEEMAEALRKFPRYEIGGPLPDRADPPVRPSIGATP